MFTTARLPKYLAVLVGRAIYLAQFDPPAAGLGMNTSQGARKVNSDDYRQMVFIGNSKV
jgi:hypothetical protein